MNIILIQAPFANPYFPSCALGILKKVIEKEGNSVKIVYANIMLLEELYKHGISSKIIDLFQTQFGEIIFASVMHILNFGELTLESCIHNIEYLTKNGKLNKIISLNFEKQLEVYKSVKLSYNFTVEFVNDLLSNNNIHLVACTSGFIQEYSAPAFLYLFKINKPSIITCMGGFSCNSVMGKARHEIFSFIDYVFIGEGENAWREFMQRECYNAEYSLPKGVLGPEHRKRGYPERLEQYYGILPDNLNNIPVPDYSEYFQMVEKYKWIKKENISILVEGSRGCWWKKINNGCKFCGTQSDISACYRTKDSKRLADELLELINTYHVRKITFTDQVIPPKIVINALKIVNKKNLEIFCEVRPEFNYKVLKQLKFWGVNSVQAGVESLSKDILMELNKGITPFQNIMFLENCHKLGIKVEWGLMCLLPYENEDWYLDILKTIPTIYHLQPPTIAINPLEIVRFSDYFQNAEKYRIEILPNEGNKMLLQLATGENKEDYYYYFTYKYKDKLKNLEKRLFLRHLGKIKESVEIWRCKYNSFL